MSIQIRVLLFKVSQRSVGVFFPCPMTLFRSLNHVSCLGPGTECVLVSCLGNKIKYLSGNLVKYSDSLKVTSIIAHINGGDMNQATTSRVGTMHYNTLHCITAICNPANCVYNVKTDTTPLTKYESFEHILFNYAQKTGKSSQNSKQNAAGRSTTIISNGKI